MNALIESVNNPKFRVIGVPCDQFEYQEPAKTKEELFNGLKFVRPGSGYVPKFPLTQKINVNGKDTHPLYRDLKGVCSSPLREFPETKDIYIYDSFTAEDIRWNFEKFLIDGMGRPRMRYEPHFEPLNIESDIRALLLEL